MLVIVAEKEADRLEGRLLIVIVGECAVSDSSRAHVFVRLYAVRGQKPTAVEERKETSYKKTVICCF